MLITNEKCFLSRIHTLEFCVCVLYCLFMCFFLFELSFPIFVMVFQISLFVLCFGQLYHFTKCASIENTGENDTEKKIININSTWFFIVAQGRIEECNQKLDSADAYADCSSLIGTNWNCVNSAPSRVGEDIHREQVRMSCGENEQGPLVCCPVWGLIRCMLTQVKNHCNPQFGDAFSNEYREDAFQPAIDQLNEQYCAEYPFASNQCDYVLQFIRDTRVLESQGISFKTDHSLDSLIGHSLCFLSSLVWSVPIFLLQRDF